MLYDVINNVGGRPAIEDDAILEPLLDRLLDHHVVRVSLRPQVNRVNARASTTGLDLLFIIQSNYNVYVDRYHILLYMHYCGNLSP